MNQAYHHSPDTRAKISKALKGKSHTPEHTAKIAMANSGKYRPEVIEKMAVLRRGKHLSPKHKAKLSASHTGKPHTSEHTERVAAAHRGKHRSPKQIALMSKIQKDIWSNPEYKRKQLKAMFKPQNHKQTKPEIELERLANIACPGEYEYVGDGKIIICGHPPDLKHRRKNKILECFGDYWHDGDRRKIPWHATELGRIMLWNAAGYDCLVIWQHELKECSENELIDRIKKFNKSKAKGRIIA